MLQDEYEAPFKDLMEMFEAVANQAGCFVHSILFSTGGFREKEIETNIKSSDIFTRSTYNTLRISTADSFLYLNSLFNDLQDLLQDDRIADVKDQINLLHQGLILLHSSINDMRSPYSSEFIRPEEPLIRNSGNIAQQAQYLISTFLAKDAPPWYVNTRLTYLNQRIHLITIELQVTKKKYKVGGLKMKEQLSLREEIRKNNSKETIVGFENETICILDQLDGGGRDRQVISIYGMPGIGKTTLAKKMYNHPLVRDRFDKLSWVVVSQTYSIKSILKDILIHINNDLSKDRILNMEEEMLVVHIHKTLKGRRYLVVLDDVWDSTVWDELQRCLPDDGNGSRILLTSRNKGVAPPNSIIHDLPFLTDEQCWELLEKRVFLHNRTCPRQLQLIGKKIAAKCHGLPLTVCVIAGVLSTVDEEVSAWENMEKSLASYVKDGEDNSVTQILELSYNHLPEHLKLCFLSFGAYKEDQEVSVEKLKRYWIAKGFIRKENEKSMENVAEEYIMELINKSLVMVAKRRLDDRRVKSCVVHDLLRNLCLKISGGETSNGLHTHFAFSSYVSALQRECAFLWLDKDDDQTSSCVPDMRLLRVLNCRRSHKWEEQNDHTFRVEYLINLRYLIIEYVPTWIENLLNLEYLTLECYETVYLPPTIVKLNKLRYIHAWRAEYSEDWNSCGTGKNSLEYLSEVVINNLKDQELLKRSPHLRKLKCRCTFAFEESKYPHFDLSFLTQLHSLSIKFSRPGGFGFELVGFRLPANITKLTLGCNWMPWENMQSIVGRLENLEVLKLSRYAFEGNVWDTRDDEFQKLRFLQLKYIRLREWNVSSSEHFPKLQHLVLRHCQHLEEIPSEMGEIATMEQIEVKGKCLDSLRESAERIKEYQREMGNEQFNVIIDATDHHPHILKYFRSIAAIRL